MLFLCHAVMFHCDEPVQMLITPVISLAPTVHRFHRDIIMKMSDNAGFRHSRVNFVSKTKCFNKYFINSLLCVQTLSSSDSAGGGPRSRFWFFCVHCAGGYFRDNCWKNEVLNCTKYNWGSNTEQRRDSIKFIIGITKRFKEVRGLDLSLDSPRHRRNCCF